MNRISVRKLQKRYGFSLHSFFVLFLTFFLASAASFSSAQAAPNNKYASIVMDAGTGVILHERNADKRLHPASLVKVMTLLLIFDALENGKLRLSDTVYISRHAANMVPSKLNLPPGSSIKVEDAIYALVTKSANDVAVALGEKLGGTESHFAVMMNRRAREIGMNRTTFMNASGLHHPRQISTARDMALLARHVLNEHPRYYHYFATRNFSYRGNTFRNHNRLMDSYRGMDGFKTGYIQPSGFNLIASAKRGPNRLIGVVFGGRTANSRNAHMAMLLDGSFEKIGQVLTASVARPPPLPGRKPAGIIQLASLRQLNDGENDATRVAELNPMMKSKVFTSLIGEGDSDPAVSTRLETGLMAIAALREDLRNDRAAGRAAAPVMKKSGADIRDSWAIQIGAFGSRAQTDKAIQTALGNLPQDLATATAIIVPLRTKNGWLFRGRLSGYSKEDALRACAQLRDCLPVSPQAY